MSPQTLLLVDAGNSALKFQCHRMAESVTSMPSRSIAEALQQVMSAPVVRLDNDLVTTNGLRDAWRQAALTLGVQAEMALGQWQLSWSAVGPEDVMNSVSAAFRAISHAVAPSAHRPVQELRLPALGKLMLNRYTNPAQLGADRWVSAVGLVASSPILPGQTHMIVSAGTATTIDLVRASKTQQGAYEFLGGWIFPGVGLMNASLRRGTRDLQLTIDSPCVSASDIPKDTRVAIAQGIGLAQTALVAPLISRFDVCQIWIHGGAAGYWQEALALADRDGQVASKAQTQPNLMFAGLMALALADGQTG